MAPSEGSTTSRTSNDVTIASSQRRKRDRIHRPIAPTDSTVSTSTIRYQSPARPIHPPCPVTVHQQHNRRAASAGRDSGLGSSVPPSEAWQERKRSGTQSTATNSTIRQRRRRGDERHQSEPPRGHRPRTSVKPSIGRQDHRAHDSLRHRSSVSTSRRLDSDHYGEWRVTIRW